MPPDAMASSVVVTMAMVSGERLWTWARSSSSTMAGWGNLGAWPKPPHCSSCGRLRPGPFGGGETGPGGDGLGQRLRLALQLRSAVFPGLAHGVEQLGERRL